MINCARKAELNILRKSSYVRGLSMMFALFTTRMAVFCAMLSICLMYGSENIRAAQVYISSHSQNLVSKFQIPNSIDFRNVRLFASDS